MRMTRKTGWTFVAVAALLLAAAGWAWRAGALHGAAGADDSRAGMWAARAEAAQTALDGAFLGCQARAVQQRRALHFAIMHGSF
ncbi:hypothetical protein OMP38_06325 [Cohnella ginsengisoli]|uniref:Uncharacterized protein n=1 Tax=Cohnella ginsengisoli TaxID=425004 RepID=A0A9X4QLP0_9BACL|nr:hypothetical protein [Cohnella ginsengisoli]MDG0790506.1 hypothetical protein [Cohnella ginsengisoli]